MSYSSKVMSFSKLRLITLMFVPLISAPGKASVLKVFCIEIFFSVMLQAPIICDMRIIKLLVNKCSCAVREQIN